MVFSSGEFWLVVLLLIIMSVLPDLVIRAYNDMTDPVYLSIAKSRAEATHSVSPCCVQEVSTPKHVSEGACWNGLQPTRVRPNDELEVELEMLHSDTIDT